MSAWTSLRPTRCDRRGSGSLTDISGHDIRWIRAHLGSDLAQNFYNDVFYGRAHVDQD